MTWAFWIDRGGTFTDAIGRDPRGRLRVTKMLSSDDAPLACIRALLDLPDDAAIPPCDVRMGTTVATNAILERRGVPIALVASRGLADVLEIGTQQRPDLFALEIRKSLPLYARVVEVSARVAADGQVLSAVDVAEVERALTEVFTTGIRSLAVVLPHAYAHPAQEQEIGRVARRVGFAHVSLSHEIDRELGLVARGDTTCVDAYLAPLLRAYVDGLARQLPGSTLRIMASSGGLQRAERFRGRDALLSGPAGGVVAVAHVAALEGETRAIGFDMGGTSTDVCRWEGQFDLTYESELAGVRVRAPMMAIHTVAAGGGSICRYEAHRLVVGPQSAGAKPGPLAYANPSAHELTLTDVDLHLGRLAADRFPLPLALDRISPHLARLQEAVALDGHAMDADAIAAGFFEVANAHMAEAIRRVSISKGHDLDDTALVVFGGAGGQHATAIAAKLGIRRLIVHPLAGVLSAWGMGLAEASWHGEADAGRLSLEHPSRASVIAALVAELEAKGRAALVDEPPAHLRVKIDLRYAGTDHALAVDLADDLEADFHRAHHRALGYSRPAHPIEVVAVRVALVAPGAPDTSSATQRASCQQGAPRRTTRMYAGGAWHSKVPVYFKEDLGEESLEGPLLILDETSTLAVDPGFSVQVGAQSSLLIRAIEGTAESVLANESHPVALEIFAHRFMSIAEDMGEVLRRAALSTNIRERLDFSCAVFDARGGLVANAPHIPVHLGAMSETVRAIIELHPQMIEGDVFASNDPALGGSHLPDITVVTPVFDAGRLAFFTACRGHHADVGGITPGSMPPGSTRLEEEGCVLAGIAIVKQGRLEEARIRDAFSQRPHPARRIDENLADLTAQIAANNTGARLLGKLVRERGGERVDAYMAHVQANATLRVEQAIARLAPGIHRFSDALDDGSPITVAIERSSSPGEPGDSPRGESRPNHRLCIDFTGSAGEHEGNLNAPHAVVTAAVIYVLRALVGVPIPLNQGCLAPVDIIIPRPSILDPSKGRAVVAGNVETSQRIVDVLLGALGLAAASQGTMNNLTFGDDRFGYYETIAGGAGAGPTFPGASAVHTHMTNTRITDLEVLETRFPVRLLEFAIRRASGGSGRFAGGDGLVRTFQALAPLTVSILSERRVRAPFGLSGGGPGKMGENRHNGRKLPGKVTFEAVPGDTFTIETPGGGGYG